MRYQAVSTPGSHHVVFFNHEGHGISVRECLTANGAQVEAFRMNAEHAAQQNIARATAPAYYGQRRRCVRYFENEDVHG